MREREMGEGGGERFGDTLSSVRGCVYVYSIANNFVFERVILGR